MLDRLIREYLDASEKERSEIREAKQKASELEQEAELIIQRATAKAQKKTIQAERIREKLRRMDTVSWIDGVIKPLAAALAETTGLYWKVTGPCGICCRVHIDLCEDPDKPILFQSRKEIVLQPDFTDEGLAILYETGETTDRFAKDTVGALNGMNNVTKPLPNSVDEILKLMRDVGSLRQMLGLEESEGNEHEGL